MFGDSIDVEPYVSADGMGDPTYGPSFPMPCRIVGNSMTVKDRTGKEVTSTVQVTAAGLFNLTDDDRFTLPAGYDPQQPPAIRVDKVSDENGPHHETIKF